MKKLVILTLCIISIPLFGQSEGISIQMNVPSSVVAGTDFEVNITFNKGDLKDYSRFSQELPSGITAKNIDSPNADFTFADQRVRIIWLKLPAENEVTVKYSIHIHERLSGVLDLGGTFAFVKDGERAYIDIPEKKRIEVLPNPNIDPELVVDISEYGTMKTSVNAVYTEKVQEKKAPFASVIRQQPVAGPNGVVDVTLLIKNPEGSNFLKLEETIPGGYTFQAVSSADAVVTQAASIARFVWMRAPLSPTFIVKYRLTPIQGMEQEAVSIDGNLSFSEAGKTRIVSVREMAVNLETLSADQQAELLESGKTPSGASGTSVAQTVSDAAKTTQPVKTTQTAASTTRTTAKPVTTTPRNTAASKQTPTSTGQFKKSADKTTIIIYPLESEQGVYYRVQIGAIIKPYFARAVYSQYDLLREAKMEIIDGWHKYTVGSLLEFDEAVQLKNRIIAETPRSDAFIVAYRDGKRIPLGEALAR